ncbi:hypothetical protein FALBO_1270 [Fusarium albosuccineum]|uniref:Uncharacterized protein n=1 Tax=Fusarium albosuccineum TaxID=1237068 RepID=A0A8H4LLZ1_9HYPO|nr:hypothetical protein FALBO_1270 [Fusarium albosuccineum]
MRLTLHIVLAALAAVQPAIANTPDDFFYGPKVWAIFYKDNLTNSTVTAVWNNNRASSSVDDTRVLHGVACSNKLSIEEMGLDLEFDVDDHGEGTLLVGKSRHDLDFYPQVMTECVLPIKSHARKPRGSPPRLEKGRVRECLKPAEDSSRVSNLPSQDEDEEEMGSTRQDKKGLTKRSAARAGESLKLYGDKDGSPEAWFRVKTLTDGKRCPASTSKTNPCSTDPNELYTVNHTTAWSASFDCNPYALQHIPALINTETITYKVLWMTTNAESHVCTSNKPNSTICLKNVREHQSWMVDWRRNNQRALGRLYAPVSEDTGSVYVCGINNCPGKDHEEWEFVAKGVLQRAVPPSSNKFRVVLIPYLTDKMTHEQELPSRPAVKS